MVKLREARIDDKPLPRFGSVIRAEAAARPTFLVVAVRVGAEKHAARLERRVELAQHARQLLCRHVEKRGVREHSVEILVGKAHGEEILLPYLAAAVFARHRGEPRRAFEAYCDVAASLESLQVSARAAAEVE